MSPQSATKRPIDDEPLMDLDAIAAYLGKSPRWVRRAGAANGLPIKKVGDSIRAKRRDIEAWYDDLKWINS